MKALVINDLHYRYPDGRAALNGVDLEIAQGMRVALLGKNGSGKTTLLLHVNGLLDGPGRIEVMGELRTRKSVARIRQRIGLLLSHVEYHFIMTDLLNDVMLGVPGGVIDREQRRDTALRWLERFGLERYADVNPLDLSSGEMKRAALAGVLARDPDLLILDEPLGNLDRESGTALMRILGSLDKTMLVATHRRFVVEQLSTHVAVLSHGAITGFYETKIALERPEVAALIF